MEAAKPSARKVATFHIGMAAMAWKICSRRYVVLCRSCIRATPPRNLEDTTMRRKLFGQGHRIDGGACGLDGNGEDRLRLTAWGAAASTSCQQKYWDASSHGHPGSMRYYRKYGSNVGRPEIHRMGNLSQRNRNGGIN